MNMYQKRKARQEKEENNSSEKSFSKTSINWESTNYLNTSQNH
jgi:hypothetical protein